MSREAFDELRNEVTAFVQEPEFHGQCARYIEYRKKLMVFVKDETLDESTRREASGLGEHLKFAFHATVGVFDKRMKASLKKYPEATPYGKVVKLAAKFEFKPSPLALGVKHYFAMH